MDKKHFIYETAAKIYSAMFTREDKDAAPQRAIEFAEELWDLLETRYKEQQEKTGDGAR